MVVVDATRTAKMNEKDEDEDFKRNRKHGTREELLVMRVLWGLQSLRVGGNPLS